MSPSPITTLCSDTSLPSIGEKEARSSSLDSTITSSRSLEISTPTQAAAHIRAEAALSRFSHSTAAVPLGDLQRDRWPCTAASFIPGVQDVQSHQAITSNAENFSLKDDFEVYEIKDGSCSVYQDLSPFRTKFASSGPVMRLLFCTLSNVGHSTFGRRLSMTGPTLRNLLELCQLPPRFVLLLLGDSDHSAPNGCSTISSDGAESLEFFCAHPRWTVQSQDIPTNVWMRWDPRTNTTIYVIVSACGQDVCFTIKRMLSQLYLSDAAPPSMHLHDPFVVHALVADELYVEAEKVARHLRYRLYTALDRVANFTHLPSYLSTVADDEHSSEDPGALTLELHEISQDLDLMLANGDMALRLNAMMQTVHSRFEANATTDNVARDAAVKMADFIRYNAACLEHQKRWLRSCASRKETAMSLVYHLIVQQDTRTTVSIARQAKDDGEAMKTIALVTMIFLPGTFLGTVFSMNSVGHVHWWVYAVLTAGMTFAVVLVWASWRRVLTLLQSRRQHGKTRSHA